MDIKFQHDRAKLEEGSLAGLLKEHIAEDLRDALLAGMITGTIITPVSHIKLLETTVKTATSIIGAEFGALCLLNERADELVFEVVISGASKELKQFHMSTDEGIAGYVARTRQPMMVNDVANNQNWNKQVGQKARVAPRNMIAAPMQRGERLIGVLEICNKTGTEMFLDTDLENLILFANQASIEVELSHSHRTVTALVAEILESCGNLTAEQKHQLHLRSLLLTGSYNEDNEYHQRLELAQLVQAIAWRGEEELRFCKTILRGFADYLA